jgi:mannose-6-phosphate isomerase-like protein (cupin superfamily)
VIDGGGHVEIDGQIHDPKAHDEFLIEPGMKHRFWADDQPFRMLVVSFGEWTPEDQERHEDDYGRTGKEVVA